MKSFLHDSLFVNQKAENNFEIVQIMVGGDRLIANRSSYFEVIEYFEKVKEKTKGKVFRLLIESN